MDKERFGTFIAEQRKKLNMTQKELADKLLISDKAVSKWERGLSYPDITLIEPLAKILSVSITELMEGRTIDMDEKFNVNDVEEAVQATIKMNESEKKETDKRNLGLRIIAAISFSLVAVFECIFVCITCDFERAGTYLVTPVGLTVTFGIYAWLFLKEKLPTYYDENKVNCYSDGYFRMNVPGVYFNNTNWPHIVHSMRVWLAVFSIGYPIIMYAEEKLLSVNAFVLLPICLIGCLGTIFVPIYVAGKKYM